MDAMMRRRTERAVEMAEAESCVFFQDKDEPELNAIILAMRQAGYLVKKITGDLQDN